MLRIKVDACNAGRVSFKEEALFFPNEERQGRHTHTHTHTHTGKTHTHMCVSIYEVAARGKGMHVGLISRMIKTQKASFKDLQCLVGFLDRILEPYKANVAL